MIECRSDKSNREELGMTYISRLLTVKIQKEKWLGYLCRTPQHQIPYGSNRIHGILKGQFLVL